VDGFCFGSQDNGLELDMAYITENIVAMGVPSADMNSGLFSFVEVCNLLFSFYENFGQNSTLCKFSTSRLLDFQSSNRLNFTDRSRNLSLKMCAFIDLFLKMFLGAK
jgi:hypothetical protein